MNRNLTFLVGNNNDSNSRQLIFDDNDVELVKVLQFELIVEMNQSGVLIITLPPSHPQYSYNFKIIGTVCSVFFNGTYGSSVPFWRGRLLSIDLDLQGNKTLTFEGLLSRLATIPIVPQLITSAAGTAKTQLTRILNIYKFGRLVSSGTATCGTTAFSAGTFIAAADDSTKTFNLSDLSEDDTLLSAAQYVITRLSQLVSGTYYLNCTGNYLLNVGIAQVNTAQKDTITPDMITSYSASLNGEPFANRVYAYGATDSNDVRLDLTSVAPGGMPYVEKASGSYSVADIGVVAKTVVYDSAKKASKLLSYANRELTKSFKNAQTYSITIVDKYAISGDYTHFGICKAVNFAGVGTMSGFDTIITKRKYDFLNPLNDSIEIEQSKKKLSSKI